MAQRNDLKSQNYSNENEFLKNFIRETNKQKTQKMI